MNKWKYESEWTNEVSMVLTGAAFYHKVGGAAWATQPRGHKCHQAWLLLDAERPATPRAWGNHAVQYSESPIYEWWSCELSPVSL